MRREIAEIKDRMAYLDDPIRIQVMLMFGEAAFERNAEWAVEAIMRRLDAEQNEKNRLAARLARLEKHLPPHS